MRLDVARICDFLRKRQYESKGKKYQREETLDTAIAETRPDPAAFDLKSVWDEEWDTYALEAALQKAKNLVSAAQFQMFYLHVIKCLPAKQVAQRLEVKLQEIYFAKYKVGRIVHKEIKDLEKKVI